MHLDFKHGKNLESCSVMPCLPTHLFVLVSYWVDSGGVCPLLLSLNREGCVLYPVFSTADM